MYAVYGADLESNKESERSHVENKGKVLHLQDLFFNEQKGATLPIISLKEKTMSKVCKDGLPADRCSVKNATCKACGSNQIIPENQSTGSWERVFMFYCNECDCENCLCSCADPEDCDSCGNQEPCGCPNSKHTNQ